MMADMDLKETLDSRVNLASMVNPGSQACKVSRVNLVSEGCEVPGVRRVSVVPAVLKVLRACLAYRESRVYMDHS